jgi:dienelactone hydrolase
MTPSGVDGSPRPGANSGRLAATVSAVVILLAFASCTVPSAKERPSNTVPGSSSWPTVSHARPTTPPPVRPDAYREVSFDARDGEPRSGRLFGGGPVAVILSHMGRPGDGQDDWAPFAVELAGKGIQVLTYQRRGALPSTWQDVLGGVDYLRTQGARRVIAGGASIGAMATLYAAEQAGSGLAGVIWLAGILAGSGYRFQQADVARVPCPMLVISGDQDAYGAANAARQLHGWATAPKELLILQSHLHGTDILKGDEPNARVLTSRMTEFIQRLAATSTTC